MVIVEIARVDASISTFILVHAALAMLTIEMLVSSSTEVFNIHYASDNSVHYDKDITVPLFVKWRKNLSLLLWQGIGSLSCAGIADHDVKNPLGANLCFLLERYGP